MTIIACPECKKQISDKAPTCVSCGAPINTTATTTIQKTGKKLKSWWLASIVLFWGGLYLALDAVWGIEPEQVNEDTVMISILITLLGVIIFFITKIRIWWHHK